MNTAATCCITILMLLSTIARAAEPASAPPLPRFDQAKLGEIPKAMQAQVDAKEISGAVTMIATREGVVRADAVGLANVEKRTPMKEDTLFWIASMTKPITATAVLMLQDEGKLSVEDPVAKYLPALAAMKLPNGQPQGNTIKLRHLLTHTSGMPEATAEESNAAKTLADLIPHFANKPLQFEPGAKWQYCQSGLNTLGRIIEIVSGDSYPEFLQKRLFDPLGMKDTTFYPTDAQLARAATPYKIVNGTFEAQPVFIFGGKSAGSHDHYPAANGGLYSTAGDYTRFCRMLLNNGALDGKTYLKPETAKDMRTVHTGEIHTGFTEGNGWGWGVIITRHPQGVTAMLSPGTFGHGGAYGTQAWIDPVKGVIYVMMVQRTNFGNGDGSGVRKAFQEAAAKAIKE